MQVTKDIRYIGVNDHEIDLFEGQYTVPNGMSYNSYVILDEKTAVMDTVDAKFTHEWLDNLAEVLGGRTPDYLVVQHMEPDHSANIKSFLKTYPETTVVANTKTFAMIDNFFGEGLCKNKLVVENGGTLSLGKHTLTFVFAPMVHWPEVMVTYDSTDKVLFSADGFGKFGALDVTEDWADEARRYYIGIVGKYGAQVQALLKKAAELDIEKICPLHGPVLTENLGYYIGLYDTWSSYSVETEGIMIAYTSVYGNTKKAVEMLAAKLCEDGCPKVVVTDLARCDMASARCRCLQIRQARSCDDDLPTPTSSRSCGEFIEHLTERGFKNRTVGFIENGSWAPLAAKVMKGMLEGCKNLTYLENTVTIKSAPNDASAESIKAMAKELCREYVALSGDRADKNNLTALQKIGYGLYVVTSNDGKRDNGLIVNTVTQVSDSPNRIAVNINKANYSHHVIKQTGIMNVNLSLDRRTFQGVRGLRLQKRQKHRQVCGYYAHTFRQRTCDTSELRQRRILAKG